MLNGSYFLIKKHANQEETEIRRKKVLEEALQRRGKKMDKDKTMEQDYECS